MKISLIQSLWELQNAVLRSLLFLYRSLRVCRTFLGRCRSIYTYFIGIYIDLYTGSSSTCLFIQNMGHARGESRKSKEMMVRKLDFRRKDALKH